MKFSKFILISLLLVIISLSAVNAADNGNLTVQSATDEIADEMPIIQSSDDDSMGKSQVNLDESILKDSKSFVITNDTFNNYFDGDGRILDAVPEGATLDFQGQITASDAIKAIYINKSVNIISSTRDATITLNSVNGTLGEENIANRFIADNVSSIAISDVTFNRTQMIIYDSDNVVLNNVKIISDKYSIVKTGQSAKIAETPLVNLVNINDLTLRNSYVYVYNLGSRIVNCSNVKEAVFDNNRFYAYAESINIDKRVNSIIHFSSNFDSSVNIVNNYFEVNQTFGGCWIYSDNGLFENNTGVRLDSEFIFNLGQNDNSNITVRNNNVVSLTLNGKATVYNNTFESGFISNDYCLAYNNTFDYIGLKSEANIYNNNVRMAYVESDNVVLRNSSIGGITFKKNIKNVTVENNEIHGPITVSSMETYINSNVIDGVITIEDSGVCEIMNNCIDGEIIISSKSSIISKNTIHSPSDYAITITGNKDYINNEISNNEIYSKLYCGDYAVLYDENYINYIEDNTPKTQIGMDVNNSLSTFDYGKNTTIEVNMPNVVGNVTIDVDGEKYVVDLVNGSASKVLTKYLLGLNNVTVTYYDAVNDVWAINHANFTVNKVIYCPVQLIYANIPEEEVSTVNFILPDDADGSIFITLTNGIYTIGIEEAANGANNIITLPGLPKGNYTISATFTSIKYVTNSSTDIISFVHVPVYNLTAGNVVMDYNDGSKYKVLVTKDGEAVGAGEIVKITFNGKTNNVKTDEKGYATLILNGAPKTYTINAEYNGVTVSSKVTIKSILKATNISKKKAKQIKFSATLKNSKGKAIIGKKITFKFKGKTYTAKTNKKGVATLTLKNLKVGKYTITSKYGACTVKNTIKIKK